MFYQKLQELGLAVFWVYFVLMLLTFGAGNGPASKKKSQKKKKRKRCEEEVEGEEFSAVENICSDPEDSRADHFGTEHQQQQQKTERTGRQLGNELLNNTTRL